MKNDNRTWSCSVKQEILYQTGIIDDYVFERLYPARQARNGLVHDGKEVSDLIVLNLYKALTKMLNQCLKTQSTPLETLRLSDMSPKGEKIEVIENFDAWKELSIELQENA